MRITEQDQRGAGRQKRRVDDLAVGGEPCHLLADCQVPDTDRRFSTDDVSKVRVMGQVPIVGREGQRREPFGAAERLHQFLGPTARRGEVRQAQRKAHRKRVHTAPLLHRHIRIPPVDSSHPFVYICNRFEDDRQEGSSIMAGDQQQGMSAAEWKVMRIVWSRHPCAAREVIAAAEAQFGWSPSTVKTLLRRLVDKRQLKTTQVGNSFLYRPARPALKTLCRAADTLLGHAVDGTVAPLLMYMAQRGNLSQDELAELRTVFDELAQQNGEDKS